MAEDGDWSVCGERDGKCVVVSEESVDDSKDISGTDGKECIKGGWREGTVSERGRSEGGAVVGVCDNGGVVRVIDSDDSIAF